MTGLAPWEHRMVDGFLGALGWWLKWSAPVSLLSFPAFYAWILYLAVTR